MASKHEETMVTLNFNDGYEVDCFVVGVFDCEGKDYMALAPDDGSDYVYIYEYKQVDDDNFTLNEIKGEDLWKKVAEEFSSIFDEEPGKAMS